MAIVRAITSFSVGRVSVRYGDLLDSNDPIVKGRENLFVDHEDTVRTTATVPGRPASPPPDHPVEADQSAARPAGNASRDAWSAYVLSLGGDPGELTRDELRDLAGELED